jgi:uncharacterized damage-inducible protein DinB
MLAWNQRTFDGWKALIERDAAVLEVSCDVYGVSDLRGLLQHIVAVELRYAQRLAGLPESPYQDIGLQPEEFFARHEQAQELLRGCVEDPQYDWSVQQEFITISWGKVASRRNTLFAHAILHSMRHFAQAAMLARQAGHKPDWSMDYLAMDAVRMEA